MLKKVVCSLFFALCLTLIPQLSERADAADGYGYNLKTYQCNDWSASKRRSHIQSYAPSKSITNALYAMAEDLMGTNKHYTTISGTKRYVNLDHMIELCTFVYGKPGDVPGNGQRTNPSTGKAHWLYLGFSHDGTKVPNPLYPELFARDNVLTGFYFYKSPWNKPWGSSSVYPEPSPNRYTTTEKKKMLKGAVDKYVGTASNDYYGNFTSNYRGASVPLVKKSGSTYDATELVKFADVNIAPTDYTSGAFTMYMYDSSGNHMYSTFWIRPYKNPYVPPDTFTTKYYKCGTPSQTNATAYEKAATFPKSTSAKWEKINDRTKAVVDSGTHTCTVTSKIKVNNKNNGRIDYEATAKHPKDTKYNATAMGYSYWVSKVDVFFTNEDGDKWSSGAYPQATAAYRYENEKPLSPTCYKWYGPEKNMNRQTCTGDLEAVGHQKTTQYYEQCYRYSDAHTTANDATCTRSYVAGLTVSGPSKAYTGIPVNYTCEQWYYNKNNSGGKVKTVNITNNTGALSSTKSSGTKVSWGGSNRENFIGTNRDEYSDPRGTKHGKNRFSTSTFYSADPRDGTYQVKCTHDLNLSHNFARTSNPASNKNALTTSKNVTHYGIDAFQIATKGCFYDPANIGGYTCTSGYEKTDSTRFTGAVTFSQFDFITSHWYDFQAKIQYSDGTDGTGSNGWRDITNASEVYWMSLDWYPITPDASFTKMAKSMSCSGCSSFAGTTGNDHRIPKSGWNRFNVTYLNMVQEVNVWAHEIQALKIRGAGGTYSSLPVDGMKADNPRNALNNDPLYDAYTNNTTLIRPGHTHGYSAWVVWSDDPSGKYGGKNPFSRGEKENWSRIVSWDVDDNFVRNNPQNRIDVTYSSKRGSDERTIRANLRQASGTNVQELYDELIVQVTDTCADVVAPGCTIVVPEDCTDSPLWQVTCFETGENFLPPPSVVGFDQWTVQNNPYRFLLEFYVTGISNGVGER